MKKIALLVLALLTFVLVPAALAITNGQPDNNEHPYVGLMVAFDAAGNPLWRCSGTLIAPRVYLTAGHCTEAPAARAKIWLQEDVTPAGAPGYPFSGETVSGTTYTHPQYNPNAFLLYDLGVVVLDSPVTNLGYGNLPALNVLDTYVNKRGLQEPELTAVGYGLQKTNPVVTIAFRTRLKATLRIIGLQNNFGVPAGTSVIVSNNANTGGTCFGDSGGPQFLVGTNIIAAVTSFGVSPNCTGTGGGYRVDQADDLNWLYGTFGKLLPKR